MPDLEVKISPGPRLWVIARQRVDPANLAGFLEAHGVRWSSDAAVPAEMACEVAGRLCYMSFGAPRPGGIAAYLENIKRDAHGSVLEHAVWGLIAAGVSRNLTHELVRHRAGFGYSQLSTRFADSRTAEFVLDDLIAGEPELEAAWREHMRAGLALYDRIDNALALKFGALDPGLTREERTSRRKAARETARQVLAGCLGTKIYLTFNARALRHFLEMRAAAGAAWEMRRGAERLS
jgi:thymidylate synthase (FAD)